MRLHHLLYACAMFVPSGAVISAGESLDQLLSKRTLDHVASSHKTLPAALKDLNSRYQARYGDSLPLFVAVELFPKQDEPAVQEPAAVSIPGLEPPFNATTNPADARLGGEPRNVPLIELLRYYADLSGATFKIEGGSILFRPRR